MDSAQLISQIKQRSQVIINNLNKINKDATKVTNEAMNTQLLARSNPALFPWL